MYDVVIVGGSFAGLAVAMQLRGHRVLIIDQRPIGTHQTSTCATPISLAQQLGTTSSLLEEHSTLILHTGGRETSYELVEPYFTFDYYAFCQAMLSQTSADVLIAKATGYEDGDVTTTRGAVSGRFIVDASGWQSLNRQAPSRDLPMLGYGVETELPLRPAVAPGLHFFAEKSIVRNGYAWLFGCGGSVRIGVCSFDKGVKIRAALDEFLARFGLQCGSTHGGGMPVYRRHPLAGQMFVVGDAAGQCTPLWAEGIRSAICYSAICGSAIADALGGLISDDEARARYAAAVRRKDYFHNTLFAVQQAVAWAPEWLRTAGCRSISLPPVARLMIRSYLRGTGWPQFAAPERVSVLAHH